MLRSNQVEHEGSMNSTNQVLTGSASREQSNASTSSSCDSAYDPLSQSSGFKLENSDRKIKHTLETIESGVVQVTLRKCHYNIGLEDTS